MSSGSFVGILKPARLGLWELLYFLLPESAHLLCGALSPAHSTVRNHVVTQPFLKCLWGVCSHESHAGVSLCLMFH